MTYNSNSSVHIHLRYGLTKHCSSYQSLDAVITDDRITGRCERWPTEQDCGLMPGLCHSWKSAGFLVILAAVLEGICLVGFLAVFNGGYTRRQTGWKILSFLLFFVGTIPPTPNKIFCISFDNNRRSTFVCTFRPCFCLMDYVTATRMLCASGN